MRKVFAGLLCALFCCNGCFDDPEGALQVRAASRAYSTLTCTDDYNNGFLASIERLDGQFAIVLHLTPKEGGGYHHFAFYVDEEEVFPVNAAARTCSSVATQPPAGVTTERIVAAIGEGMMAGAGLEEIVEGKSLGEAAPT